MESNFLQNLEYLAQIVGNFTASENERSYRTRTMALGFRFSEKLKSVESIEDLSALMIKGNQAAYAMGIPEFSSQINNLAEIKKVDILTKQGKIQASQRASILRGLYGDTFVAADGKYMKLSETKEFQDVAKLNPELQADAYKFIYDTMQTNVQGAVEYLGNGQFGYSEFAISNRDKKPIQIAHYLPVGKGKYDNAMIEGLQLLDEPFQITQAKGTFLQKQEEEQRQFGRQIALIDAQLKKSKDLAEFQTNLADKKQQEIYSDPKKWSIYEKALNDGVKEAGKLLYDNLVIHINNFGSSDLQDKVNKRVFLKQNNNGESMAQFIQTDPDIQAFIKEMQEDKDLQEYYNAYTKDLNFYTQTEFYRFLEKGKRAVYESNTPGVVNTYNSKTPSGTKPKLKTQ